jgi:hypothetical protein
VPWATGKHQLTKAYMLFLAHWARSYPGRNRRVLPQFVAQSAPGGEYVVEWGLTDRSLGPIVAISVDEIQYGKGRVVALRT